MSFNDRLSFLMDHFELRNNMLARAVNVDPSLVSRWRSGKRTPSLESQHLDAVAQYFAGLNSYKSRREYLIRIISSSEVPPDDISTQSLKNLLKEWLVSPLAFNSPTDQIIEPEKTSAAGLAALMIDNISTFANEPAKAAIPPATLPNLNVPEGELLESRMFFGEAGVRQGLINFLAEINRHPPGEPILMSSPGSLSFFAGDSEFRAVWASMLGSIINRGNVLKIIFKMDRSPAEMMMMLKIWFPLVASGKIEAYYLTRYSDLAMNMTLTVMPGTCAMMTLYSGVKTEDACTFLYQDNRVVDMLHIRFNSLLEYCRPLIKPYNRNNFVKILEEIAILEQKPGYRYMISHGLPATTLPLDLYMRLISSSSLEDHDQETLINEHKKRIAAIKAQSNMSVYRDIISLTALDEMINENGSSYPGLMFAIDESVYCELEAVRDHLQNTITCLQILDHYEIALIGEEEIKDQRISWLVKEDQALHLYRWEENSKLFAISTSENTVVDAFFAYSRDIWEQIPAVNKERPYVIQKLKKRLDRIDRLLP